MIDPASVPAVDSGELLARFIVHSSHIRKGDSTIKPDAFIPHPYNDLSVSRHRDATVEEMWQLGVRVSLASAKTLHGRGDVLASAFLSQKLRVQADPTDDNPNHVIVIDWPADKPAQKILAQEIAAQAAFIPLPTQ